MENALQHALKNAMTGATKQWFDDEPDTRPQALNQTQEKSIVQAPQTPTPTQTDTTQAPERGTNVRFIYKMLVETPKVTCAQLEKRAKDMGYPWFDSISGQLKLLYDRGLVMRVKLPAEGTEYKPSYRYWPIAMTLEDAVKKTKEEREAKGKPAFSINKEKATKEKTVRRLVPKKKPVPTVEQFEQAQQAHPIQMLRVGVDPKRVVEGLSVRDARAVYEELKKLFS